MNNNGADTLHSTKQDDIALAAAVENRMLDLYGTHKRITGEPLQVPQDLLKDIVLWRQLRKRHKKGDFRSTSSEEKATKHVAQFTLDVNARIRNQKPVKMVWET